MVKILILSTLQEKANRERDRKQRRDDHEEEPRRWREDRVEAREKQKEEVCMQKKFMETLFLFYARKWWYIG